MESQEKNQLIPDEEQGKCYGSLPSEEKEESVERNGEHSNDSHQEKSCDEKPSTDNTTVPTSPGNQQGSDRFLETLIFILGNRDLPKNLCSCSFLQFLLYCVIRILPLPSIAVLATYLVCYFGKVNHLLIFLSFVSYWLSVTSPQFISLAYILKNSVGESFQEDVGGAQLFLKKHIYINISRMKILLGVYSGGFLLLFCLRLAFYYQIIRDCYKGYDIFWAAIDIISILYYTLFCIFLCSQRLALEKMGYDYFSCIGDDLKDLKKCKEKVLEFYHQYKRVREVAMPWISIILFFSSLGVTAIFTWNYHSVAESPLTLPKAKSCNLLCCAFTCDKVPILLSNSGYRHWSNGTVMLRNVVVAGFALLAVNGSDLKHVWDTFRLRLFTFYQNGNNAELQDLMVFLDCIHTESGIDSMGMAFTIAGFVVGILGSEFR